MGLSGPTTVTSVVKDYAFTATVRNASGQGIGNVEVTVNSDKTVRTNHAGVAKFNLNFRSVGMHGINVRVRDKESGKEFQKHFSNRVEVPAPHSIELVKDFRLLGAGGYYSATFVVRSADGKALEGFDVKMSVGKWVFEKIGAKDMIVPLDAASPGGRRPPDFFTDYDINARTVTPSAYMERISSVAHSF